MLPQTWFVVVCLFAFQCVYGPATWTEKTSNKRAYCLLFSKWRVTGTWVQWSNDLSCSKKQCCSIRAVVRCTIKRIISLQVTIFGMVGANLFYRRKEYSYLLSCVSQTHVRETQHTLIWLGPRGPNMRDMAGETSFSKIHLFLTEANVRNCSRIGSLLKAT